MRISRGEIKNLSRKGKAENEAAWGWERSAYLGMKMGNVLGRFAGCAEGGAEGCEGAAEGRGMEWTSGTDWEDIGGKESVMSDSSGSAMALMNWARAASGF